MGENQYHDYAKTEFADVADSWVVAFALSKHPTI
jgi:hypothetical protein